MIVMCCIKMTRFFLLDASQIFMSHRYVNYTHFNDIIMLIASVEFTRECELRDITASSPREALAVLLGVQM